MTVRREDGSVVEIATADIVSGKPVPPRAVGAPSPRRRAGRPAGAAGLAAGRERAARRVGAARLRRLLLAGQLGARARRPRDAARRGGRPGGAVVRRPVAAAARPRAPGRRPRRRRSRRPAGPSTSRPCCMLASVATGAAAARDPSDGRGARHDVARRRGLAGQRRAGGALRRARARGPRGRRGHLRHRQGRAGRGARARSRRVPRRLGRRLLARGPVPTTGAPAWAAPCCGHCWRGAPSAGRRRRTCRWSRPTTQRAGSTRRAATRCTTATTTWSRGVAQAWSSPRAGPRRRSRTARRTSRRR